MTPTEELLKLPFLQLDQVKDSLDAYQLSKRANSLRLMAEAVRGKRGARLNTISPGIVMTPLAKDELTRPRGAGYPSRGLLHGIGADRLPISATRPARIGGATVTFEPTPGRTGTWERLPMCDPRGLRMARCGGAFLP